MKAYTCKYLDHTYLCEKFWHVISQKFTVKNRKIENLHKSVSVCTKQLILCRQMKRHYFQSCWAIFYMSSVKLHCKLRDVIDCVLQSTVSSFPLTLLWWTLRNNSNSNKFYKQIYRFWLEKVTILTLKIKNPKIPNF